MSSNYEFVFDQEGDDCDWIEIYNNSEDTISLENYYLSDNYEKLDKWRFPNVNIQPDSYLVVFASGKDTVFSETEIHTSFSISTTGEYLYLFDGVNIVHSLESVFLEQNQSYGLLSDGGDEKAMFEVPSPGGSNELIEVEKVIFSQIGGIYDTCFSLYLNKLEDENIIRYTIDGSIPLASSPECPDSLFINSNLCSPIDIYKIQVSPQDLQFIPKVDIPKAVVVRAACFDSLGNRVSKVSTNTYFIREMGIDHFELPILSLNSDYNGLFDDTIGIFVPGIYYDGNERTGNYYQKGDSWEREAHVEFYESDNSCAFNQTVGLRIHGDKGRRYPQKTLRIYARSSYGKSQFYYSLFSKTGNSEYKRLILKPFSSSWSEQGVEDYLANCIADNMDVDHPKSRPIILYLNGEYWGVYFIMERADEYYFSDKYNIDKDSIYIVEDWSGNTSNGNCAEFVEIYNYIKDNDLSVNSNYYHVTQKIDINSFIDYQLLQIFVDNYDWPANNMKCWKSTCDNSKWRWIFYDGDAGFREVDHNMFEHAQNTSDEGWPTNESSTLIFRKLLENNTFRFKFSSRLEYLLNNNFKYGETTKYIYDLNNVLTEEVSPQSDRFGIPEDFKSWYDGYYDLDDFLVYRPCTIYNHFKTLASFDLEVTACHNDIPEIYSIEAYPNPSNGNFNLNLDVEYSVPIIVSLVNCLGQKIILYHDFIVEGESTLFFENLDVKPGLYIIGIFINGEYFSDKLYIQK